MSIEKPTEETKHKIYITAEEMVVLANLYKAAINSQVPEEVVNDAFDIAHENITTFSVVNFAAALDIKLKLDNSVAKFYKR